MSVIVVGSGGREHALALALATSADVIVTPGNPAMAGEVTGGRRISVSDAPPEQLADETDASLVVIGPEQPLVDGLADRLRARGRQVLGPGADGARLEGSKAFMKQVLAEAKVPTARFAVFGSEEVDAALSFLRQLEGPWVVKTDGLAGGKGVLVTEDLAEAEADVRAKLSGRAFGDAGRRVVIEEGLRGSECSLLVLTDGRRCCAFAPAQDYKRVGDGDSGPNTGGMGAFSPVPSVTSAMVDRILDEVIEPTLAALRRRGIDYRGVLYAGLMLTVDGPYVLEYNVRFGDPEAQVVVPRIDDDVCGLLSEAAAGRIRSDPKAIPDAAVCVVMASEGYPSAVRSGDPISGLEDARSLAGVTIYHSGTALDESGRIVTAGGRVLGVTAMASDLLSARQRAYEAVKLISWEGVHFRTDIAAGLEP